MTNAAQTPRPVSVWVIGEALVDIVTIAGVASEMPGGSPTNVAFGLGMLGVGTELLTHVGDDDRGRAIVRHVERSGATLSRGSLAAGRTSTAAATIDASGAASYVFDIDWDLPADVTAPAARIIHTGSIATFLEPGATRVRELLASTDASVTYDPNIRPGIIGGRAEAAEAFERTAALCTLVKLSDEDAEWLYPGVPIADVLDGVLARGPAIAVATLGAAGSLLRTVEHSVELPAAPVVVVDTIGAGDTYMASLVYSLLQLDPATMSHAQLTAMGMRAATAAGITVSRSGAALPTLGEVERALAPISAT